MAEFLRRTMYISQIKIEENFATIEVEIDVQETYPLFEKIELSPRWKAAAKSLAIQHDINLPIVQIDGLDYYRSGKFGQEKTQSFRFYYGKGI